MRTCQFCGTRVEAAEAAAEDQPVETLPEKAEPEPPASAPSAAPESPRAKAPASAEIEPKKRILFYAATVLVTLMGLALVFSMVRANFAFSFFGDDKHSSSPGASRQSDAAASSGAAGSGDLGIDIYPGATALSEADRDTSADSTRVSQSFVSSTEMPAVINFYKAKMDGIASIYASGDGVVISIRRGAQDSVLVAISPAPSGEKSGGKTRFSISHTIGKP